MEKKRTTKPTTKIPVNRAPVLTLWGAIVAERLGYREEEALSLGRAVAGLNAQSKGRKLGIFKPATEGKKKKREEPGEFVKLLHRSVPVVKDKSGVHATSDGKPISPVSVRKYLEQRFGKDLERVRKTMEDLARSFDKEELAVAAYRLYEEFRPEVPEGEKGWGVRGILDLKKIRTLAE